MVRSNKTSVPWPVLAREAGSIRAIADTDKDRVERDQHRGGRLIGIARQGQGEHQRGFTLIEILVVVVIIALLAWLLYPSYTRSVEISQVAGAENTMKEISAALNESEAFGRSSSVEYSTFVYLDAQEANTLESSDEAGVYTYPGPYSWSGLAGEAPLDGISSTPTDGGYLFEAEESSSGYEICSSKPHHAWAMGPSVNTSGLSQTTLYFICLQNGNTYMAMPWEISTPGNGQLGGIYNQP